MDFGHLKDRCAGCERSGMKMTKEHLFPKWLIRRTGTDKTSIRWVGQNRIPALAATFPLCDECNRLFGEELEDPVSSIFDDLESQRGISESEAELLVRWLWKLTGLFWIAVFPQGDYTQRYTLRERVLRPIDKIRGDLILAISLIRDIEPEYGDKPMGVDSCTVIDAIFASGVFSSVAVMVLLDFFDDLVPRQFTQFHFLPEKDVTCEAKLFHPEVGFGTGREAVTVTWLSSKYLSAKHDELAIFMRQQLAQGGQGGRVKHMAQRLLEEEW